MKIDFKEMAAEHTVKVHSFDEAAFKILIRVIKDWGLKTISPNAKKTIDLCYDSRNRYVINGLETPMQNLTYWASDMLHSVAKLHDSEIMAIGGAFVAKCINNGIFKEACDENFIEYALDKMLCFYQISSKLAHHCIIQYYDDEICNALKTITKTIDSQNIRAERKIKEIKNVRKRWLFINNH